jgi:hypothetical protein
LYRAVVQFYTPVGCFAPSYEVLYGILYNDQQMKHHTKGYEILFRGIKFRNKVPTQFITSYPGKEGGLRLPAA